MEPIVVLPAKQLQEIIDKYVDATNRLLEAEKELAALKDDHYVTWNWVCQYFGVNRNTAMLMLSEVKVFAYGSYVKRFKRSDILLFAERNSIQVNKIPPLAHKHKTGRKAKSVL